MTRTFTVSDFNLQYTDADNGGGTSIGLDFKNILTTHYPGYEFNNCLEWCSGPGFIGFDLLLNNYCTKLTLLDKHKSSLNYAIKSLEEHHAILPVKTVCFDNVRSLPATEKFDLIVANPPHFSKPVNHQENIFKNNTRIYLDPDWNIHKEFFQNISKNLTPNGIILLQESSWGCNYDSFDEFLVNIKRTNYYQTNSPVDNYPIFYIEYKLI
jgi:methylase of polypeptide subunit release factors